MQNSFYLVLDLGTTTAKSFIFDSEGQIVLSKYIRMKKIRPNDGWVEQDPLEMVEIARMLIRQVVEEGLNKIGSVENIKSLGITNQRETTIIWDKNTGRPIYSAIVWEDSRTDEYCRTLAERTGELVREKTGLSITSYSSAPKICWILDHVRSEGTSELQFGTVDSWLIHNLSKERNHVTDITNASRTLLFDIHKKDWSEELLNIFDIPPSLLPGVKPSYSNFGTLSEDILGKEIPIMAVCGDQQGSMFAAGHNVGDTKVTYGTGAFLMQIVDGFTLEEGLLTTLTADSPTKYAVEGKIEMGAERVSEYLDDPTKARELEEVVYEIARRVDEGLKKLPHKPEKIYIDGGISQYDRLGKTIVSIQEEVSGIEVVRQPTHDGTALGVYKLLRN